MEEEIKNPEQQERCNRLVEANTFINAKDALIKTKSVHLSKIQDIIQVAINNGKTECEILPTIQFVSEENKGILESLGYKVTKKVSMLGEEILINWENA